MMIVMWKLLCLFSSVALEIVCGKLVGDHICLTEESYTVNVTEQYVRNATVRNYKWCLNVPPRCSFYTIKKIYDTRIAERNKTRVVEKCCPGFIKENQKCVPQCNHCKHGVCKGNMCQCSPEFNGMRCEGRCGPDFGGSNCKKICCSSNFCNPVDGKCGKDNIEEDNTVNTTTDFNELFIENTVTNIFEDQFNDQTTEIVTLKESVNNFIEENDEQQGTVSPTAITTKTYTTLVRGQEDNIKGNSYLSNTIKPQNILILVKDGNDDRFKNKRKDRANVKQNVVNNNVELLIPVGIHYDQIAKPLQRTLPPSTTSESNIYLKKDGKMENSKMLPKEYYFINSVSISTATTVIVILFAVVVLAVRRKYKYKIVADKTKDTGVSPTILYTKSIFHTPLPDPPTCENPTYLLQGEFQKCIVEPTLENRVICTTANIDSANYEYDYPPSSGSYRAASLIEPFAADENQTTIAMHTEPVYDEIPCHSGYDQMKNKNPMSLYRNI